MKIKNFFWFTSLVTMLLTVNGCEQNVPKFPFSESNIPESNIDNFKNKEYREELILKYKETKDSIYMEKLLEGYKHLIDAEGNYPAHYFNRCQLYLAVDFERAAKECHVALVKIDKFQIISPEETLASKYDILKTLCQIYILKKEFLKSDKYCLEAKNIFQNPTLQNLLQKRFGEQNTKMALDYLDLLISLSKKRNTEDLITDGTVCQTSPDSKLCQDVKNGSL